MEISNFKILSSLHSSLELKIFDEFYTIPFISKEIVDLHGGQILAESKGRNEGSTILIKLPLTNTNYLFI